MTDIKVLNTELSISQEVRAGRCWITVTSTGQEIKIGPLQMAQQALPDLFDCSLTGQFQPLPKVAIFYETSLWPLSVPIHQRYKTRVSDEQIIKLAAKYRQESAVIIDIESFPMNDYVDWPGRLVERPADQKNTARANYADLVDRLRESMPNTLFGLYQVGAPFYFEHNLAAASLIEETNQRLYADEILGSGGSLGERTDFIVAERYPLYENWQSYKTKAERALQVMQRHGKDICVLLRGVRPNGSACEWVPQMFDFWRSQSVTIGLWSGTRPDPIKSDFWR